MKASAIRFAALAALTSIGLCQPESFPTTTGDLHNALIKGDSGFEFVSYSLANGYAITDGDVIAGTEEEFKSKIVTNWEILDITDLPAEREGPPPEEVNKLRFAKRAHSIFGMDAKAMWPGNTIRYRFADEDIKNKFLFKMNTAISRWKKGAPCLKFVEEKVSDAESKDILTLRWSNSNVCYIDHKGGYRTMGLLTACTADDLTHEIGRCPALFHFSHCQCLRFRS